MVQFGPLRGQVCYLKWGLRRFFADDLDIFYKHAEMGNDECTEMQLKFKDSPNPAGYVSTPKVGGTSLNLGTANYAVITQNLWVSNLQRKALAPVVRLGQNRVLQTWLLNTRPKGYDNGGSDLHQRSAVAQWGVLNGVMSRPNFMNLMKNGFLGCCQDHTKGLSEEGSVVLADGEDVC